MSYTVSAIDLATLSSNATAATDTVQSVLQNIAVILSTPKGTVPMYRDFGIDTRFLDSPIPTAELQMRSEIREMVEKWEPRATVKAITFSREAAADGKLIPIVEVEIHG